jgi:nitrogen fixation/metabolism regulation signal transduction histidine kinase
MLKNITIKSLLLFAMGILSLLLVGTGVIGLISLDATNKALKTVYEDRTVSMGQLDKVITLLTINQLDLAASIYGDPGQVIPKMDAIEKRSKEIDAAFQAYADTYATPEEKVLSEKFAADRKLFIDKALAPAVAASRGGNVLRVTEIVNGPMEELIGPVRAGAAALIELQLTEAAKEYHASQVRFSTVRNLSIAAIIFGVLLAGFMAFWLIRLIARPLREAVQVAKSVADGDLTQRISVDSTNETGQLLQALKDMHRNHHRRFRRNRVRQPRPLVAHRRAGQFAGRNRFLDGRADLDRQAERR